MLQKHFYTIRVRCKDGAVSDRHVRQILGQALLEMKRKVEKKMSSQGITVRMRIQEVKRLIDL